jgi:hypothetical protein
MHGGTGLACAHDPAFFEAWLSPAVVGGLGHYDTCRDLVDIVQVKIGGDGCQRAIVPGTAMGCQ